ncbi:bifunctional homocysteine S-methyltransferase/methylenetetrahydrofolate reductase [Solidesulfovibrio sp.]|uniref:bifunctional homocysteine S-methyltransferase/methylenetetrahydrofolate reductase n=1 Tax=Solidesulfovibrio sp. TaxID=2910990 RepID=UPI002B1F59DB|nr:bifunctional homocysteine S-methyltransferase/methylenetetrahydrofolate reductase [Solidesulfovibrio sp.]MEA5088087.1 bifunctional homocysteine S-methyltransferase/methylenetetrahydrofolate reductase [Solidesulfovibrio sp.]
MRHDILDLLAARPVLADGAMGSQLAARGLAAPCLDLCNIEAPDAVRAIHQAYLAAGAEVIETNTFGANRRKLARCNQADRTREINRQGALLARACAGSRAFVAGAMGPVGRLEDEAEWDREAVAALYAEQARALAEGGADLLILETFADLELLRIALGAAKAATPLPVAAQMVFGAAGSDLGGRDIAACLRLLREEGADIVGLNCGMGPRGARDMLRAAGPLPGPVSVFPNAGFPERRGDRLVYPSSPEYFADMLMQCAQAGARLLGGCCGTGPEHIRALHRLLAAGKVAAPGATPPAAAQAAPVTQPREQEATATGFAARLGSGRPLFLVELDPPKHLDVAAVLEGADALARAGVDAITLAENPLAAPRLSNIALAQRIRARSDIEVIVHLTGRDRNLIGMQSTIMGLACLGLENVLAVTGDPPSTGGEERLSGVFDVRSFELIALLENFRQGRNAHGQDMRAAANFCIGAAFNPNTRNIAMQVKRLSRKAALGARYFLTQPVYAKEKVDEVIAAVKDVAQPIFLGIMPLVSLRNAEFLHNEFPGITIPEPVFARLREAGDGQAQEGLEIAWELMEYALPHFAGMYVIPPFNRYPLALELIKRARTAFPQSR